VNSTEKNIFLSLNHSAHMLLALGICLVVLGILAILFTYASTVFSVMYLGAFLIVLGILEGIKSFTLQTLSSFLLHIGLSALYAIGGIFMLLKPETNAVTLTLFLAIFFALSGVIKIGFALTQPTHHKQAVIFSGLINLILGIIIWYQWPVSGTWVIGTLVGVDTLFAGWTLILLALKTKKAVIHE
jgi:uncharacterized membrane protein HdeD (DUF308 family)